METNLEKCPWNTPDGRSLSDDALEAVRWCALRAREKGYSVAAISDILGVCRETVSRWCSAYQRGGARELPGRKTGRPVGSGRTLTDDQENFLIEALVEQMPEDFGIASALWTRGAVAELIRHKFSLRMPIRTVGEYLKRWGFTPQRPARRARRQDPEEVRQWLDETYPHIASRARKEQAEIHWGDETGVRSSCYAGRGYAAPGNTPAVKISGARFSVNLISSITNQGKVRWMTYAGSMTATVFLLFLSRLIRPAGPKIFLIVDNLKVHDAAAVHAWLAEHRSEIEVFYLPKYSPELNPDEYLNCDIKGNVNAAGLPENRAELQTRLANFMQRLAKLPDRIASYFQHPDIQFAGSPL